MNRLVIAEDNISTLAVLSRTIDWGSEDIVVAGAFESGTETLEYCLAHPPEALLVDIKLPGMDGLSIVNRLRDSGIRPVVVVVSAHSDFELAQSAIRNNVHDYLLKPLDYSRVREVVVSGLRKADVDRAGEIAVDQRRSLVADRVLLDFLARAMSTTRFEAESVAVGLRVPPCPAAVIVARVDGSPDAIEVLTALERASASILGTEALVTSDPVAMTLIAIVPTESTDAAMNELMGRAAALVTCGPTSVRRSAYVAIGPVVDAPDALPGSFERAMRCAGSTFGFDATHVAVWYDWESAADEPENHGWEKSLVEAALAGSRENASTALHRLREQISRAPRERGAMLALAFGTIGRIERQLRDWSDLPTRDLDTLTDRIATAGSMTSLVDATVDALAAMVERVVIECETVALRLVQSVDETIRSELGNRRLTVAMIAERVGYTPSYLTRLYARETGRGVLAAINERRIELAVSLLVHTDATIAEIAERVGCASAAYFSTFFRRQTGSSPRAFRRAHQS